METTFITIHDLSSEARILYSSDSIVDILGHTPDEVVNKPCWEFFHPNDLDSAKSLHSKGVQLDKAAVLVYCLLAHRDGRWINCECCFTCVYNVMVVCTSVYRPGLISQKRASEAPIVRRLFTSSPEDPRYHMLSHLSTKFQRDVTQESHEPRAALFLNRFTRTLTVMYATSGIEQVIGISGEGMKGRSFYYCIAENCLEDAVKCLETAKGNDSIAYLRFWFRDPRQDDAPPSSASEADTDAEMTDATETEDEGGGVRLDVVPPPPPAAGRGSGSSSTGPSRETTTTQSAEGEAGPSQQRLGHSAITTTDSLDRSVPAHSSTPTSPSSAGRNGAVELEAVVSCTSDGLVVILRRARPIIPGSLPDHLQTGRGVAPRPQPHQYPRGIFAAPWAPEPVFIPDQPRPEHPGWYYGMHPQHVQPMPPPSGPNPQDFMNSIREVAVFAWALVGINGNLADYGRGLPGGQSQPPEGFPVWDPHAVDSGNATQTATPAATSPQPFGKLDSDAGRDGEARG